MAKKRLNQTHRMHLRNLASGLIAQTTDRSNIDAAYDAAAKAISEQVSAMYPAEDMAVLLKYDLAYPDTCIYVSRGGSDYDMFDFRSDDWRVPMWPWDRRHCSRTPILLNDKARAALDAYDRAKKAVAEQESARRADFRSLIDNAKTFEEVVEVWPAAEQLRSKICGAGTAISVMSEDVIARIKADAAATAETA